MEIILLIDSADEPYNLNLHWRFFQVCKPFVHHAANLFQLYERLIKLVLKGMFSVNASLNKYSSFGDVLHSF